MVDGAGDGTVEASFEGNGVGRFVGTGVGCCVGDGVSKKGKPPSLIIPTNQSAKQVADV